MTRGTQNSSARDTSIRDTGSWCFWNENFDIGCSCACDHIQYNQWHIIAFHSRICQHLCFQR